MRSDLISKLVLALAVAAASLAAVAAPDSERGANREEMRGQRQDERQAERQNRQSERQNRQNEMRAVREAPPQFDPRGQPGESAQPAPEGRHGSRMSPEERRALRRQIDQASHDIYAPNR
jgi:Ni/Co efflux regulator RcnB